jgi:hypothetical protein
MVHSFLPSPCSPKPNHNLSAVGQLFRSRALRRFNCNRRFYVSGMPILGLQERVELFESEFTEIALCSMVMFDYVWGDSGKMFLNCHRSVISQEVTFCNVI